MSRELGKPERGEVSVGQSDFQRWCVRKVPRSIGATRRFRGVLRSDAALAEFPNSLLEPCHRFRRETPLRWLVIREAEPQEFPFPWTSHRTLLAVHSKLKLRREESRHASHHSFTSSPTADVNVAVIRISREPMSAPLQLLIQFVEYDVRYHG